MEDKKVALKNFTEEELKEFMKEIGEKPFRGSQVFSWIYKGAKTFDDMRNIPKTLREKLEKVFDMKISDEIYDNLRGVILDK